MGTVENSVQAELLERIRTLQAENDSLRRELRLCATSSASAGRDLDGSEQALREEKRTLEVLNQTGAALAAELDLNRLVQIVTDAGVKLVGAAFGAFFYSGTDEHGEKYMLYALSGAPREAFSRFPMPGPTSLFGPTFRGEGIVRCDDVTQDPRYGRHGPHYGMPPGHLPVRSYLAVPVISRSGEVLGGLFFGHPEAGRFGERSEQFISGIAAQAAIAVDNARLLQAVQDSERRFRALIERSGDGIAVIDADNNIKYLSPSVLAIEGYTAEELVGRNGADNTHPDDLPVIRQTVQRALDNPGQPIHATWRRRHKDGRWLWLEGVATNLLHDPAVRGIVTNYRDITLRKRVEEVQIRSQKIEALGTLAGGIAHDFNNILLAINGNAKLALEDLPADHPARSSLAEIDKASQRAADLVRRILTFSRQEEPERQVLDLEPVIQEALKLLRATLPAMIEIKTRCAEDVPKVSIDSTQIHQIIMNLCTNAAHAIGNRSGSIEVVVETVDVGVELASTTRELHEGRYARISVTDTGCGMDSAIVQRIFDPFFTTKPVGQGTGLGLSVVHGIVKNHDGAIVVHTYPGKGTTFRIYLPAATQTAVPAAEPVATQTRGQGEHVLYVDDDEAILFLGKRVLERLGYRISAFNDPKLALEEFRRQPESFDVVVTDLSMPGMSGFDMADSIQRIAPGKPILMTSGYVRPEDRQTAREHGVRDLILKPNTIADLGVALDRVLRDLRQKS